MNQQMIEQENWKILVIDDHELVIGGTIDILQKHYPNAEIVTAQTAQDSLKAMASFSPDVIVMDLSIPEQTGEIARTDVGLQLLKNLMKKYPEINFVVQSAHARTLVRIKQEIDSHKGGFTIADKSLSRQEMLTRVNWALQGLTHTKDIKSIQAGLEFKPEWLKVLELAYQEGLQDKAIADRLNVSERMVRHYWTKLQDALNVYPEEGKNIRIQTEMRAREEGLID
ncbi:response regulator [[Phormidium ambiguum] IAM M-71]|uniref:Response regulator n=1 Tax=[Phormidium ambiguum] IAM M-71 TaxID=454136 RepID=A0A1U7ILD3_9CYAN|nr:response regulator transcription factor [Phormidium ambiguum]OKH38078.1 response regulator [Phormidium ambiguum IAM M-71]